MTHELDAAKYCGTDVEFEREETDEMSFGSEGGLYHNGDLIGRIQNIEWGAAESIPATGTAFYLNRINCTYNNYKRNTKTLIL